MALDKRILIIGSDSLIGGSLMGSLQRAGENVIGTTRRRSSVDKSHVYLDLSEDVEVWQCPLPVSTAIVCAGVTRLDSCRNDPLATASINVKAISILVKHLVEDGVFMIYLSSNQVFDGKFPNRLPDDQVLPITEYGKQKAEVEQIISQWPGSTAIIRFSKVLGSRNNFFPGWINALQDNKVIHPFSDIFMSPVPLFFAISVLNFVRVNRLMGILQVSGEIDVSYADIAYRGAQLLGRNSLLVQPVPFSKAGVQAERLPRYSTLNTSRLKSILGIEVPDVWWTIEKAFVQPGALDELIEAETIKSE